MCVVVCAKLTCPLYLENKVFAALVRTFTLYL